MSSKDAGSSKDAVSRPSATLTFTGSCDASGAVPLDEHHFVVADDEDNVLRIYDANRGGAPVFATDISGGIGVHRTPKKKKPHELRKAPEADIEAGTRVGDLAFWITSHARNRSGKLKPERQRFFATTLAQDGQGVEVVGSYERLLDDLIADARFSALGLAEAAERAPKDSGGLNIEGLTHRVEGGVFIGLRNPTVRGKAIVFALFNPEEVLHGRPPRFGDPILLDLGGLGVRSLSWWRSRYLIIAGSFTAASPSHLYTWDGQGAPTRVPDIEFHDFNPEGFFTPEERDAILLLSDDGTVSIDGTECKRLADPARKRFRGMWVTLPPP